MTRHQSENRREMALNPSHASSLHSVSPRALSLALSALWLVAISLITSPPAIGAPSHGLSAFGEFKYPADFKHFDYVNPDAPKGGKLSMIGTAGLNTFDTFNGYILKGDAAQGLRFLFDSLMTSADDEPDAVYGLVAESADLAGDKMSVTFKLRPQAKFSDGSPLRASDVKYSYDILKEKGHPQYRTSMRDVIKAEVIDPLTIKYSFKGNQIRDLPLIVSGLPIFSQKYYSDHDFTKTTLQAPLGSGPYKIIKHKQGNYVVYERRKDYWARDLAVNRGRFNFDTLRYEYYRERISSLENLKNGSYDLREEFTSKDWATAYNVPPVKDGRILLLTLPDKRPGGAQGFFLNTRRGKFADVRVRRALDLAFDFEWTNKALFYSLYKRTESYFENSNLKAQGKPSAGELKLLEPFRAQLPESVFGEVYHPPASDGSGADRKLLRKAVELLKASGWTIKTIKIDDPNCGFFCRTMMNIGLKSAKTEQVLRNAKGKTLDVEFLIYEPSFERVIGPYVRNLKSIGINAFIRRIDSAQFQNRVKSFDFDIITQRFVMSMTPGAELNAYLSSTVADTNGSYNLPGIKDPVVDALIGKISEAASRAEMTTATQALDRVLRAKNYWVSHWYKAAHNIAHWDKFSRPKIKPRYARGVIDTWWFDADKAAKVSAK